MLQLIALEIMPNSGQKSLTGRYRPARPAVISGALCMATLANSEVSTGFTVATPTPSRTRKTAEN